MRLKINLKWLYLLEAFFTALAFSTANRIITPQEVALITTNTNFFSVILAKLQLNYQNGYGVNISILFIIIAYFFYSINKKIKISEKRLLFISSIGGFILATCMTIGNRFFYNIPITDSPFQILVTFINAMGYFFLFQNLLTFFISILKEPLSQEVKENKKKSKNRFIALITTLKEKYPILFFMLLLLICWLPYIIIFYPGTMNYDSVRQVCQYFGTYKWFAQHPVFLTIVYGNFMRLGQLLINDNFGLFLNNITQILVGSFVLSYSINYIYKLTNSKKLMYLLFVFFAFFPTWPIHFYTEVKDIWFSISFLVFVIFTIKFIKANGKLTKIQWFIYFCSMILTYLCRKNGVFIILFTFPFLAFLVKKKEKIKIITCSVLAIILSMSFLKIYMATANVEKGNIKDALSIPLHQTAYYYHTYELTDEEATVISKVINLKDLKEQFIPESVDFVKSKSKTINTSNEDLKNYLITWFKMFLKHPGIYLKATLNSTYGYIYPNRTEYKDGIAQYTIDASGIFEYANTSNLDLHFLNSTETARNILQRFAYLLRNMPLIGLFFSCGFYVWILIALSLILIYFKKIKELVVLIPLYVIILVCIASPVNAYVRYTLPVMLSLPFVASWLIYLIRKEEKN